MVECSEWVLSLQQCTQLKTLRLSQTGSTSTDWLARAAPSAWPQLTVLSLHATSLSDRELIFLSNQSSLKELNLSLLDGVAALVNPFRIALNNPLLPCPSPKGILATLKTVLPHLDTFRFCASPAHLAETDILEILKPIKQSQLKAFTLETPSVCIHSVLHHMPASVRDLNVRPRQKSPGLTLTDRI
jgi:hypothetical protein